MKKKDNAPWKPTQQYIRDAILARGGYGVTTETSGNGETCQLVIWREGKEHARYVGEDEKMCLYECFSVMVRSGEIAP